MSGNPNIFNRWSSNNENHDYVMKWINMTNQEKVIRLVKGGMQQQTGMTVEEFILIYKDLLINHPEKLI